MANELTPKQEKFAQLLGTSTITQSDAYRQAYDASNMSDEVIWNEASLLAKNHEVSMRIEELRNQSKEHLKYDAEAHFKELNELKALALVPSGEFGTIDVKAGIKATELKGKLVGLYTDQVKVAHTGGINVQIVTGGANVTNPTPTAQA